MIQNDHQLLTRLNIDLTPISMKHRALGNSHLSVTPVGLGLAALGRPGYINLGAVAVKWNDSLAEQLDALVETPETYWHIRSQLAWN